RPAEVLDLLLQARVVGTKRRAHVLRVGAIGARGEPDQVDEEDRNDLPLFCSTRCLFGERGAARPAEPRAVRVLLAALRARGHAQSLRRSYSGAKPRVSWGYRRLHGRGPRGAGPARPDRSARTRGRTPRRPA